MKEPGSVLIITRDFPPYCSLVGRMVRAASLANFLSRRGMRVHVLGTKRAKAWPKLYRIDNDVQVHWIRGLAEYYNLPRSELTLLGLGYKALRRAAAWLFASRIIDLSHFDVSAYTALAKTLIAREEIEIVIISTPPHSLQLVGLRLREAVGARVKLVVDYRDAWTLRQAYEPADPGRSEELRLLEKRVLDNADEVVFVSRGMARMYEAAFNAHGRWSVVENGFLQVEARDPELDLVRLVERARQVDRVVIGYFGVGSIGIKRKDGKDLTNLIRVLHDRPDLAKRICLVVQGEFMQAGDLPADLWFALLPGAPYDIARANMAAVDVGINMNTSVKEAASIMGGKVYDYVAAGVPLLLLMPCNAESLRAFADETGKPFLADIHAPEQIGDVLERIIAERDAGTLQARGFTEAERSSYSRDGQYQRLLHLLANDS